MNKQDMLDHLQQLIDYVRPEGDNELVESEIVLKELLKVQKNMVALVADFSQLKKILYIHRSALSRAITAFNAGNERGE